MENLLPTVTKESIEQRNRTIKERLLSKDTEYLLTEVDNEVKIVKKENPELYTIIQNYSKNLPILVALLGKNSDLALESAFVDIYMSLRLQAEADAMKEDIKLG